MPVRIVLAVSFVLLLIPATAHADGCQFMLGFQTMSTLVDVGACLEDQHVDSNGDQVQQTTKGLLIWHHLDNAVLFTDGYRTWVNGPQGLQQRLNTECFDWEHACVHTPPAVVPPTLPSTTPPPAPAPVPQNVLDPEGIHASCAWAPSVQFRDAFFPGPFYRCEYKNGTVWFAGEKGPRLIESLNGQGWSLDPAGKARWPQYAPAPLTLPSLPRISGFPSGSRESIEEVKADGAVITLDDGSVWLVDDLDRIDTALWLSADDVVLADTSKCLHETMINTDESGETACVERLS